MRCNANDGLVDLTLAMFEYNYNKRNRSVRLHMFNYVDDIVIFDCVYCDQVLNSINKIIPLNIQLYADKVNFLDINIKISGAGTPKLRLFDKTQLSSHDKQICIFGQQHP